MSRRGIIYDRLKTAWEALSAEQRTCWHFTAQQNPTLNAAGELRTQNGWQYFVDTNSALAVVDESYILTDPPTTTDIPEPINVIVGLWPIPSKLAAGGSTPKPKPWTQLGLPVPSTQTAIITQGYDTFENFHQILPLTGRISCAYNDHTEWLRAGDPLDYVTTDKLYLQVPGTEHKSSAPRVRHVTTMIPDQTGAVPLDEPTGYFATTAGLNKFATIKGLTARRRPDLPLGKLRTISLVNGRVNKTTIPNPTGQK